MLTLGWPWGLAALAAVPFVVLWYRRLVRARAARRAELAALGLVGPTPVAGWRRTVAPALLLSAVVLYLVVIALLRRLVRHTAGRAAPADAAELVAV